MIALSDKQKEYARNANHRWNIKTGAVRSGKSFVDIANVIPERIISRKNEKGLVVIAGVSRETVERNVLQPMREIYTPKRVGTINTSKNTAVIFGQDVYCLGAEKISQVGKIQGSSIKYCYGDEIAKWNKEFFEMLKSRLDKSYSCFDGACNPENPTHWLKKFIDSDADIYLQKYRIFDNPFLPEQYVTNLCKEYEGTIYYDRLIEGKWKRAEGAIYRKFADNPDAFISPADIENIRRIDIGVDFGGEGSGHSFVATAKYANGIKQPIASRKHMNKDFSQGIDANILSELFLEFVGFVISKYGMPNNVYWDNAETVLGNSIRNACAKHYPSITVAKAKKIKINDRIAFTVQLIGAGLFFITEDCETLSTALQEAVYDNKTGERLDDGSTDIDTLDAYEYSVERDFRGIHYNSVSGGI